MATQSIQQQPVIYVANLSATDNEHSGGYYQVEVIPPMIPDTPPVLPPVVMPSVEMPSMSLFPEEQ
jgi:hypothetical protein